MCSVVWKVIAPVSGFDELDVDAAALEGRDRLGVGVHHVALALLEQAGHAPPGWPTAATFGSTFFSSTSAGSMLVSRAAEDLGDLDQRHRAERGLEAGEAEPRHPGIGSNRSFQPLGARHLLRIVGDADDLGVARRRPMSSISPAGTLAALVSFLASNGSNRPASMAGDARAGIEHEGSRTAARRAPPRTLATWSTANSGCISSSMSYFFLRAGATTLAEGLLPGAGIDRRGDAALGVGDGAAGARRRRARCRRQAGFCG